MSDSMTRRDFIGKTISLSALTIGGAALLTACGKKDGGGGGGAKGCYDVSGLKPADVGMRKSNAYVDKSPHADKLCSGCQLYKPAAAGAACGGCTVLKGPIAPGGYCNLWAKKAG